MANGIEITVVGNLTADPELRYTQSGLAVANLTIAHNSRVFDRQTGTYKDGDPVFLRTSAWRQLGEHVAASLVKGQTVIAKGDLVQRSFNDKNTGEKRTAYELELHEIGVSLRFGTTTFQRDQSQSQQAPVAQGATAGQPVVQQQAPVNQQPQVQQAPQVQQGQPVVQQQAPQVQQPQQPQYQQPAGVAAAQAGSDDVF